MKILFMGTPDFAKIILEQLHQWPDCDVIGVITQPDKPKGRGYTLMAPPVKQYACEQGIPVYQPNTLRSDEFYQLLQEINPEVIVVAAYGKLLPKEVLDFPPYGCINVHGSLLPQYRGAAPMQRAIMEGQTETGVTIMMMAEGLDTGDMLKTASVPIDENDDFACIHDRLAETGGKTLIETLAEWTAGKITPQRQDDSLATYAAKITKEDRKIDFSQTAHHIHNQIRGLHPAPLAFTTLHGKNIKILQASVLDMAPRTEQPGTVLSLDHDTIAVACSAGILGITRVGPEGKKHMNAGDFIRGRQIAAGDIFGK
ncbi:MAG: methionyl-tRNA formyltransferase [Clostridiales bacterium]|nr:methionyl-tRNA formyltransferase [Clostridiales bacterium]